MRGKRARHRFEIMTGPRAEPFRRGLRCAVPCAVVLGFFLFHADGALADHSVRGTEHPVVAEAELESPEASAGTEGISGSLLVNQPGAGQDGDLKPKDLTWLRRFCPFNSAEVVREGLGPFPHLDDAFLDKLADFERRLCMRKIAGGEKKYLLDQGPYPAIEERVLRMATECGYLHELAFPRFARAFLILGEDFLRDREYFRCRADQHLSDAMASMHFAMNEAGFRVRNIDRFGPDEGVSNAP